MVSDTIITEEEISRIKNVVSRQIPLADQVGAVQFLQELVPSPSGISVCLTA